MSKKENKKTHIRDRIPLSEPQAEKIDAHIKQVQTFRPGTGIYRKDYIAHLIDELPPELSSSEVKKLADKFFDKKKFLRYLLNKVDESSEFDLSSYMSLDRSKSSTKKSKKKATPQSQNLGDSPTKQNLTTTSKIEGLQDQDREEKKKLDSSSTSPSK